MIESITDIQLDNAESTSDEPVTCFEDKLQQLWPGYCDEFGLDDEDNFNPEYAEYFDSYVLTELNHPTLTVRR